MPQVCFNSITWYIEIHHMRTFFVWRHDFFEQRHVHSEHVYLQEESLPGVLRLKKALRICPDHMLSSTDKQRPCWQFYGRQNHGKLSSWRYKTCCEWTSRNTKSHDATQEKFPHVVHVNVSRDWFETNSRHQKRYSVCGKKNSWVSWSTGKSNNGSQHGQAFF